MYKRRPVGDYHVGVCTNTLCAVMGGDRSSPRLKEHLGVGNDETTEDGKVTLEHIECNAACDYAPVMMVNWEFFDNLTPRVGRASWSTTCGPARTVHADPRRRGSCTWREAERVLAGFPDGRADEGRRRPASLAGLRLAHERGWTATRRPADDREAARRDRAETEPREQSAASRRAATGPARPRACSDRHR